MEVKARRGPRTPKDPDELRQHERERIEARSTDDWIDEGSVRDAAEAATGRAGTPTERPPRRAPQPLDAEVAAELADAVGRERGQRLADRLAQASEALDRERFDEAKRIASSIAKEAPGVSAAHEVVGLSAYRLGQYRPAAKALETAKDLHTDPALLPVLADCYRALGRYSAVERVWLEIREASPAHEILSEGKIVAAGALADKDDLRGAIDLLVPKRPPKRVRDHHLREWYVLGDLYDRLGDPIDARRWFEQVASNDRDFADVGDRLRALGR